MTKDTLLIERFIKDHPLDAARILERLNAEEIIPLLTKTPHDLVVHLFHHFERYTAIRCLELLEPAQSVLIIEELPLAISSLFLRRMKDESRDSILKLLSKETAGPVERLLRYPDKTAGALMDPLVFTLPEEIQVKEALERVQKRPHQAIYYLYIVNSHHNLCGVMNLRELLLANPEERLSSIMQTRTAQLSADANFQAILDHPGWLDYHAMPVVDRSDIFLGVIRYETLRSIERMHKKVSAPRELIAAGNALGELYRIGLSGLVRSAIERDPTRNP